MIQVVNERIFLNLFVVPLHPMLLSLILFVSTRAMIVITSAFRIGRDSMPAPGVHGTNPLRGLDIRSHHLDDPQALCDDINKWWSYDYGRPQLQCALFHDVGQGAHIHLQVHPNTRFVIEGKEKQEGGSNA